MEKGKINIRFLSILWWPSQWYRWKYIRFLKSNLGERNEIWMFTLKAKKEQQNRLFSIDPMSHLGSRIIAHLALLLNYTIFHRSFSQQYLEMLILKQKLSLEKALFIVQLWIFQWVYRWIFVRISRLIL